MLWLSYYINLFLFVFGVMFAKIGSFPLQAKTAVKKGITLTFLTLIFIF